jgi:hypothetical protein
VDFSVAGELPLSEDDVATGSIKSGKLTARFAKGTPAFWTYSASIRLIESLEGFELHPS